MTTEKPQVNLSFNPVSGEFTLKVTNTTRVSYTLEYDWENSDDQGEPYGGTEALINTDDANQQHIFQETKLAGTESSGDKFVHQPTKGVLTLSAETLDDKVMTYQSGFKITEAGVVKKITEQTSIKAKDGLNVLGESSSSGEKAVATFSKPTLSEKRTTQQPTTQQTNTDLTQAPLFPIVIGGIIILIVVSLLGAWWLRRRRLKQTMQSKLD